MNEQRKRPPVAIMSASAALHAECESLKKIADAGYEVVIVRDEDLEASLKIVERVRLDTLKEFKDAQQIEETCKWKRVGDDKKYFFDPHTEEQWVEWVVKTHFKCCPTCGKKIEEV